VLRGHGRTVTSVGFSPDGRRLISNAEDSAKVWDAETGRELVTLPSQPGQVVVSSDGKRLLFGSRIFYLKPD
jgi:WD40 repeat protein